ncbi:MAG TPA: presenilin family intramembrane aspartyl protease PSH [Candidatus Acidoferrales bacterium]|nr:presenilin family intramembrane aspartyl protease PSH [Candidatus Acidoferrales bacterium]
MDEILKKLSPFTMVFFILIIQVLGLLLAQTLNSNNVRAFSNPQSVLNPIYYLTLIIAFTLFLLAIIKFGKPWMIKVIMGIVLIFTLYFVYETALFSFINYAWIIALALTVGTMFTIFYYPEWFVIDSVGILVGAGAVAIFGVSLSVVPVLILLILLAVYDFISVYETKHMIRLAEGVIDLKVPVLFVLPRSRQYSHAKWIRDSSALKGEEKLEKREAYFMGLGDAVIPSTLVISANFFLTAPSIGFVNIPALGAMIGILVGYASLMILVSKGKPQAGLPLLNTGAIIGFFIGSTIAGIKLF